MLAHEQSGHPRGEAAEGLAGGVDDVPGLVDVFCLEAIGFGSVHHLPRNRITYPTPAPTKGRSGDTPTPPAWRRFPLIWSWSASRRPQHYRERVRQVRTPTRPGRAFLFDRTVPFRRTPTGGRKPGPHPFP